MMKPIPDSRKTLEPMTRGTIPQAKPKKECPSCRKTFVNLNAHLRRCSPKLIPKQPQKTDPLPSRAGGGETESVEHVLLECPALEHLRPAILKNWHMKSPKEKREAMTDTATADFVRKALGMLKAPETSSSSSTECLTAEIAALRPPPRKSGRLKPPNACRAKRLGSWVL